MSEWVRRDKYFQDNGTHRVAAVRVLRGEDINLERQAKGRRKGEYLTPNAGGKLVWGFEAWRVPSSRYRGTELKWLGLFETAEEARAYCERDERNLPDGDQGEEGAGA